MAVNNDIDALKHLYSKLGGASDDVSTINTSSEMIERIGDLVEGGGSGGGTSGIVYVDMIMPQDETEGSDNPFIGTTLNITPRELWPQLLAGKRMLVRVDMQYFQEISSDSMPGCFEVNVWAGTDFDVKSPSWYIALANAVAYTSIDADTPFAYIGG